MTLPEQRQLHNRLRDARRFAQVKHLTPSQAAKDLQISLRTYYRLAARVRAASLRLETQARIETGGQS